jgi:hypothetical protein
MTAFGRQASFLVEPDPIVAYAILIWRTAEPGTYFNVEANEHLYRKITGISLACELFLSSPIVAILRCPELIA